jgi:hypothetical protein
MKKMTAADFVTNCEGDVIEIEDSVEAFLVHLAATLPLRRGVDRGQVKKRLLELWHENREADQGRDRAPGRADGIF